MRSRSAAAVVVLAAVLVLVGRGGAPAVAIETTSFGLDITEPASDGRLHIPTKAGETTSGKLRLFNKTDASLTIKLTVSPATVAADGTSSLGGDDTPVGWIDVERRVSLAPRQEKVIEVRVHAPRRLPKVGASVAIVAEPELSPTGTAPAVLQRVAMTTLLEPDKASLIASLGWYPWLAVVLLAGVAAATLWRARARRRA